MSCSHWGPFWTATRPRKWPPGCRFFVDTRHGRDMTRHDDRRCSMYRVLTYIGVIDGVNGGKKSSQSMSLLRHGLFGVKGRVSKYRRLAIGNAFQLIIRFCICQLGTNMIAFPLGCATCIIDSVTRDILPIASRYQYP